MMSDGERVRDHFDSIAENYNEEIATHVRQHLNEKWWALVSPFVPSGARVLDLGCGDATNVAFLREKGVEAMGIDFSPQLVRRGIERYPRLRGALSVGDVLRLPFPSATFDCGIMTGVLHHIYSKDDQLGAVSESLRVIRPGGVLIIRESNLRNPAFRLYWNYVFPLTARIDRFGGENWISVGQLEKAYGSAIERVSYFTFIPASTPQVLLGGLSRIERALERSPLKSLAAHYIAVIRKSVADEPNPNG